MTRSMVRVAALIAAEWLEMGCSSHGSNAASPTDAGGGVADGPSPTDDARGGADDGSGGDSGAPYAGACIPSAELSASFGGFEYHGVIVDENNPTCSGGVCLVNHFEGLTSCPYGQVSAGNALPGAGSGCTVPGTSTPVSPDEPDGGQEVLPWCLDRPASAAVYCSCRCQNGEGGADDGGGYCSCPAGYSCIELVPASADGAAGAYCVKSGTEYEPDASCSAFCDPVLSDCPN